MHLIGALKANKTGEKTMKTNVRPTQDGHLRTMLAMSLTLAHVGYLYRL